jgi:hypothetical protein
MRRREFLGAIGIGLICTGLARAQQKVRVVGTFRQVRPSLMTLQHRGRFLKVSDAEAG